MKKKSETVGAELEVTFQLKKGYEVKKVVIANNEFEAALEAADYLQSDFDLYWSDHDYEVSSVVRID